jgi:hypothetical protein
LADETAALDAGVEPQSITERHRERCADADDFSIDAAALEPTGAPTGMKG